MHKLLLYLARGMPGRKRLTVLQCLFFSRKGMCGIGQVRGRSLFFGKREVPLGLAAGANAPAGYSRPHVMDV